MDWRRIGTATPEPITAALGPEAPIVAPEPGAPATGLLRAARVIDHGADDMRWANGLSFSPENCGDAIVFDPCAVNNTTTGVSTRNRPGIRSYTPFVVDAYDACSTFGWEAADYEARARRMLARVESKAIAKEFWTAAKIPGNPHLADAPNVTTVATGLAPLDALSRLVQAMAEANAGQGMVHMRPRLLEYLAYNSALRYENGQWLTATGSRVAADAGYPGTSPAGAAIVPPTEWMFGTDPVEVHRGPVEVFAAPLTAESVDHTRNNEVVRVQRLAAPLFNGCALIAVSVTVPLTI